MCKDKARISMIALFLGIATTVISPACLANSDLSAEQSLGKDLYFDENLSLNRNQACASCHSPGTAFVDPRNTALNQAPPPLHTPVSEGSVSGLFGTRNAPSAAYALYSPFFHWDGNEGLYVGGQFWDGRANSLSEQAAGPFLNPVEMAMPNKWAVIDRMRTSRYPDYVSQFREIYGIDLSKIPAYDWGNFWNGGRHSNRNRKQPPGVLEVYDRMTRAIGEFEKTNIFTTFSSKFDYEQAGMVTLSPLEQEGMALFNGKGQCFLCHISTSTIASDGVTPLPAMFTDFTYDNLGVPANLYQPGSPLPPDLGLGGRPDIAANDPMGNQLGKFKVMTLRNIANTPPYGHNGVFQTLKEIVHFYNTRDVLPTCDPSLGNKDPGFGTNCWPEPEVAQNVNHDELGNLGLSDSEEDAIVAFMETLSDGWGAENGYAPLPAPPLPPTP